MIIAALLLAALSVEGQVFHEPLCENLPEVGPEVKAWVAQVAPELAQVSVRELPEQTALDVFGRAAAAGWGSVDVLTNSVFREPCTFYFSREALRAVNAAFVLDLVTAIQGQDKKGQDFEMIALLAGRGKIVVLYDRGGIAYRNERLGRDFTLDSRVEFETPAAGALENVQGLCANVRLLGCVRVRSIVKVGETLKVQAGTFTSQTPSKPIQARATPVTPLATRAGAAPRPVPSTISLLSSTPAVRFSAALSVKWVRDCAYSMKRDSCDNRCPSAMSANPSPSAYFFSNNARKTVGDLSPGGHP